MKVTWEDLGCPDGPGTYAFKDGTINVRLQEMSIWFEHPGARRVRTAGGKRDAIRRRFWYNSLRRD
jgi:hypothetical protein